MTRDELANALQEELGRIAPEIEFQTADRSQELYEAFDIDSMDFLNLVTAMHKRWSIPIPESDYDQLRSIDQILDYLMKKTS